MNILRYLPKFLVFSAACLICCSSSDDHDDIIDDPKGDETFYFGADLSYVNQVLDHGGTYKVENTVVDPYKIFKSHGSNLVRLRIWHNPAWTKEVYGGQTTQLYNDLADVERAIAAAKAEGLAVLLDFHYSDEWADPSKQYIPAAWKDIKDIQVLADSVYNYTSKTLHYLDAKDLLPEFVQIGNEINCGMLYSTPLDGFPTANACNGQWQNLGKILNAGIKATRDVSKDVKVILHVADPKNVEWWFDNIKSSGSVSDFDVVGFSYYPLWHTTVSIDAVSDKVALFKNRYGKDVMILETAYPWTTNGADSYNNHFGSEPALTGFPKTPQGQFDVMVKLTQEVKSGGGIGVIYWEPAWITSQVKDMWGTGSSWENCTFFDFQGNVNKGIEYMQADYE